MRKSECDEMSNFLEQANGVLRQMEADRSKHVEQMDEQRKRQEQQFGMYREIIDNSMKLHTERMAGFEKRQDANDKRLSNFMNIAIGLFSLIIIPFVIGGFTFEKRLSNVEEVQAAQDPVQKTEAINSIGVLIEQNGDAFEYLGMPEEEVEKINNRKKDGVTRAMGDISRGSQPIEE